MKTQDKKTIFIECNNEAWKFKSAEHNINYETGLFFGKKIISWKIKIYLFLV